MPRAAAKLRKARNQKFPRDNQDDHPGRNAQLMQFSIKLISAAANQQFIGQRIQKGANAGDRSCAARRVFRHVQIRQAGANKN